jgi:hypothetical protein
VYGVLQGEEDGVLVESNFGPVGNNATHVSITPGGNWVKLTEPIVKISEDNNQLNPTFKWEFQRSDGSQVDVDEINLFVSTADAGDGLYPWDNLDAYNTNAWNTSSGLSIQL